MGDIEHLRLGFCSLIMQAKGSLISSFVAWLDLKVAEYKVYGHMILTEDSEGVGSDAWQYTTPAEPVSWPRSLPDSFHGHQAASHLGTNSTFMRSVPPSRRGLRAPYSRPVSLNNRPRPARPKSVTNLLKNAISRSSKSSTIVNARSGSSSGSGPSVSNSQPVILTAGTEVSTVSVPSITQSGTSETDYTAAGSSTESSTLMAASPSSCVTNEQNIKEEPGLLMSVESEDGDRLGGEQSMWLGDAATAVVEQSPSTSYAAQTSTGVTPNISSMTPSGSRGPSSTQVRSTGGVAQRGVLPSPQAATRHTPSKDSVNDLLQTHTIQTETGFVCGLCQRKYNWRIDLQHHIRAIHLGLVFKCAVCDRNYQTKSHLKQHMKKCHTADLEAVKTFH